MKSGAYLCCKRVPYIREKHVGYQLNTQNFAKNCIELKTNLSVLKKNQQIQSIAYKLFNFASGYEARAWNFTLATTDPNKMRPNHMKIGLNISLINDAMANN